MRLPRSRAQQQGYRFEAGQPSEPVLDRATADLQEIAAWLERFTTSAELQRGFDDGTFRGYLPVEGKALLA